MLKKRIIFTLLYDDGSFMLSRNFRLQKVGDLQWLKKNYNFSKISLSIDELIILDITRKKRDKEKFIEHVHALSTECFVPLAVGGGINDIDYAHKLINSGADKIVVNSLIGKDIGIVVELVNDLGSQCIVASIDVKKIKNDFFVFTQNGTLRQNIPFSSWVGQLIKIQVGEIYLTSIDKDGTGQGYQMDIINLLPDKISIPVIMSGGAGKWQHLMEGLDEKKIDAVSTAHLFNFIGDGLEVARFNLLQNGYNLSKWDKKLALSLEATFKKML
jgi:imidazole glycerol-phosphate synthase subunit HisF